MSSKKYDYLFLDKGLYDDTMVIGNDICTDIIDLVADGSDNDTDDDDDDNNGNRSNNNSEHDVAIILPADLQFVFPSTSNSNRRSSSKKTSATTTTTTIPSSKQQQQLSSTNYPTPRQQQPIDVDNNNNNNNKNVPNTGIVAVSQRSSFSNNGTNNNNTKTKNCSINGKSVSTTTTTVSPKSIGTEKSFPQQSSTRTGSGLKQQQQQQQQQHLRESVVLSKATKYNESRKRKSTTSNDPFKPPNTAAVVVQVVVERNINNINNNNNNNNKGDDKNVTTSRSSSSSKPQNNNNTNVVRTTTTNDDVTTKKSTAPIKSSLKSSIIVVVDRNKRNVSTTGSNNTERQNIPIAAIATTNRAPPPPTTTTTSKVLKTTKAISPTNGSNTKQNKNQSITTGSGINLHNNNKNNNNTKRNAYNHIMNNKKSCPDSHDTTTSKSNKNASDNNEARKMLLSTAERCNTMKEILLKRKGEMLARLERAKRLRKLVEQQQQQQQQQQQHQYNLNHHLYHHPENYNDYYCDDDEWENPFVYNNSDKHRKDLDNNNSHRNYQHHNHPPYRNNNDNDSNNRLLPNRNYNNNTINNNPFLNKTNNNNNNFQRWVYNNYEPLYNPPNEAYQLRKPNNNNNINNDTSVDEYENDEYYNNNNYRNLNDFHLMPNDNYRNNIYYENAGPFRGGDRFDFHQQDIRYNNNNNNFPIRGEYYIDHDNNNNNNMSNMVGRNSNTNHNNYNGYNKNNNFYGESDNYMMEEYDDFGRRKQPMTERNNDRNNIININNNNNNNNNVSTGQPPNKTQQNNNRTSSTKSVNQPPTISNLSKSLSITTKSLPNNATPTSTTTLLSIPLEHSKVQGTSRITSTELKHENPKNAPTIIKISPKSVPNEQNKSPQPTNRTKNESNNIKIRDSEIKYNDKNGSTTFSVTKSASSTIVSDKQIEHVAKRKKPASVTKETQDKISGGNGSKGLVQENNLYDTNEESNKEFGTPDNSNHPDRLLKSSPRKSAILESSGPKFAKSKSEKMTKSERKSQKKAERKKLKEELKRASKKESKKAKQFSNPTMDRKVPCQKQSNDGNLSGHKTNVSRKQQMLEPKGMIPTINDDLLMAAAMEPIGVDICFDVIDISDGLEQAVPSSPPGIFDDLSIFDEKQSENEPVNTLNVKQQYDFAESKTTSIENLAEDKTDVTHLEAEKQYTPSNMNEEQMIKARAIIEPEKEVVTNKSKIDNEMTKNVVKQANDELTLLDDVSKQETDLLEMQRIVNEACLLGASVSGEIIAATEEFVCEASPAQVSHAQRIRDTLILRKREVQERAAARKRKNLEDDKYVDRHNMQPSNRLETGEVDNTYQNVERKTREETTKEIRMYSSNSSGIPTCRDEIAAVCSKRNKVDDERSTDACSDHVPTTARTHIPHYLSQALNMLDEKKKKRRLGSVKTEAGSYEKDEDRMNNNNDTICDQDCLIRGSSFNEKEKTKPYTTNSIRAADLMKKDRNSEPITGNVSNDTAPKFRFWNPSKMEKPGDSTNSIAESDQQPKESKVEFKAEREDADSSINAIDFDVELVGRTNLSDVYKQVRIESTTSESMDRVGTQHKIHNSSEWDNNESIENSMSTNSLLQTDITPILSLEESVDESTQKKFKVARAQEIDQDCAETTAKQHPMEFGLGYQNENTTSDCEIDFSMGSTVRVDDSPSLFLDATNHVIDQNRAQSSSLDNNFRERHFRNIKAVGTPDQALSNNAQTENTKEEEVTICSISGKCFSDPIPAISIRTGDRDLGISRENVPAKEFPDSGKEVEEKHSVSQCLEDDVQNAGLEDKSPKEVANEQHCCDLGRAKGVFELEDNTSQSMAPATKKTKIFRPRKLKPTTKGRRVVHVTLLDNNMPNDHPTEIQKDPISIPPTTDATSNKHRCDINFSENEPLGGVRLTRKYMMNVEPSTTFNDENTPQSVNPVHQKKTTGSRTGKVDYYSFDLYGENARKLQEQLFQEAAERAKANVSFTVVERCPQKHVLSIPTITSPILNISERYPDHWKWSNDFARLGLPHNSSVALVKSQFRRLAKIYHPDKSKQQSTDKFHAITKAYHKLMNIDT